MPRCYKLDGCLATLSPKIPRALSMFLKWRLMLLLYAGSQRLFVPVNLDLLAIPSLFFPPTGSSSLLHASKAYFNYANKNKERQHKEKNSLCLAFNFF